ncbi:MAG: hypothetical protein CMK59_04725 [Proteobacteria bacterium]|nr:hypothetical protein [Pseudomonadota bacterium]
MDFWLGGTFESGGIVWAAKNHVIAVAALLAVLVFLGHVLSRVRYKEKQKHQFWEWFFLFLSCALMVFIAADPRWISESGVKTQGKYVVLVDSSSSMKLVAQGRSRSEEALKVVERLKRTFAEQGGEVDLYSFDGALSEGAPEDFSATETDFGVALHGISDRYLGQSLRGIALVSDGIDRGTLKSLYEKGEMGTVLPKLPGPLTIYPVGDPKAGFDESVVSVATGGFAYQRMKTSLTAKIQGVPNGKVKVGLYQGDQLVRTPLEGVKLPVPQEEVVLLDETGRGEVTFFLRPLEVGRFSWEVRIAVAPTDVAPSNNTYPVVLKVLRDKIRVLQVSGSPSYDQKFLRLFLKQDPSVELISFFILRTREDFQAGWEDDELSLIAFPYDRLFTTDLESFDLVIFQNFNYKPYFNWDASTLLQNIADYVEDGHGFVMMGGNLSFDMGEYANTPIEPILPVKLGVESELTSEDKFLPSLTKIGAAHPITQLSISPEETRRVWERLPMMDGYNKNMGLASGAAALLVHPTAQINRRKVPILAVRKFGLGRVMSLGVDASWRWSFSEALEGEGNQAYLRFWKNALRWLVADPEDRSVVVTPSKENALIGEELNISVLARDAGYQPVAGADIRVELIPPQGERLTFSEQTDASGHFAIPYTPKHYGTHTIRANYGEEYITTIFAATSRDPELIEIMPNMFFLEQLAEFYEGKIAKMNEDPLLDKDASRQVKIRNENRIGRTPAVLMLLLLTLSLSWFFRRRGGAR